MNHHQGTVCCWLGVSIDWCLNPRAVFDCICGFSSNCDRKGLEILESVARSLLTRWTSTWLQMFTQLYLSFLLRIMFVKKIYFYKLNFALKHYKSIWQYSARNWKADVGFLVLFILWVYGNWCRRATQSSIKLVWTVTEIPFCKTPAVDEKRLLYRGWESARETI